MRSNKHYFTLNLTSEICGPFLIKILVVTSNLESKSTKRPSLCRCSAIKRQRTILDLFLILVDFIIQKKRGYWIPVAPQSYLFNELLLTAVREHAVEARGVNEQCTVENNREL